MRRLYVSKVETLDSELNFKAGAVGPAWYNLLGRGAPVVRQIVDSVEPAQFAVGILDTSTQQHQTLISASTRVMYIPANVFGTSYADLGAQGQASVQALQNFLGFNLIDHTVELIVWALVGHAVARGVDNLSDLL